MGANGQRQNKSWKKTFAVHIFHRLIGDGPVFSLTLCPYPVRLSHLHSGTADNLGGRILLGCDALLFPNIRVSFLRAALAARSLVPLTLRRKNARTDALF